MSPFRTSLARLGAVSFAAALLAGCVSSGGPGASSGPSTAPSPSAPPSPTAAADLPADPNTLVLRVASEGGFVMPDYRFIAVPEISLYADGRVMSPGAQIMIYPGPLLPAIQVATLPLATVRELLADAAAAGLAGGKETSYPSHDVADVPDTVFTVWSPTGVTRSSFGALGIGGTGTDPIEKEARKSAEAFQSRLSQAAGSAQAAAYAPVSVRLLVRDYVQNDPAVVQEPVAWPLAGSLAAFGQPLGTDSGLPGRCGVINGTDLETLWPVFAKATAITPFTSGGNDYQVSVRPLLPDEQGGC